MSWHTFEAYDGSEYGSYEAFYLGNDGSTYGRHYLDSETGEPIVSGWYWWACFPGCLPDSEPDGPYATEREAIEVARDFG
jgi:hypothetical protein